jgi:hypothetical protein
MVLFEHWFVVEIQYEETGNDFASLLLYDINCTKSLLLPRLKSSAGLLLLIRSVLL